MVEFNVTQDSFLGGEWSESAQGRITDPRYKQALRSCLNCVIYEEGACTRRPGFMEFGHSYQGQECTLLPFDVQGNLTVFIEITRNNTQDQTWLRFWAPADYGTNTSRTAGVWNLLPDDYALVTSVSSANPAILTINAAPSPAWNTNDEIYFVMGSGSGPSNGPLLRNRQFRLQQITTTTFYLIDPWTGVYLDGSSLSYTASGADYAAHVKRISGPSGWAGQSLDYISQCQQQNAMWIFLKYQAPYILSLGGPITTVFQQIAFSFSLAIAAFTSTSANTFDGPYLDAPSGNSQTGNDTATLSSMTTVTPTITLSGSNFQFGTYDVGRQIRLWSQPPAYNNATSYSVGDTVTYQDAFYTLALAASAGIKPNQTVLSSGVSVLPWTPTPKMGVWRYGVVTSVTNTTVAILKITTSFTAVSANGTTIDTYTMGAYFDVAANGVGQYPAFGTLLGGRLWLTGAYDSRWDASASNATPYTNPANQAPVTHVGGWFGSDPSATGSTTTPLFSPTDQYGTVADNNAIAYTMNAPTNLRFLWLAPEHDGLIVGTAVGEFLISAPTSGPISPTNIAINAISTYGSAFPARPIRVGSCLLFVQTLGVHVLEYMADVFKAGKYTGRHLNADAKHLTNVYGMNPGGIRATAYQEEIIPTLWCVTWDGKLRGMTYRRNGSYPTQPPEVYAWHPHTHGTGRIFISLATGYGGNPINFGLSPGAFLGNRQALLAVTKNETSGEHFIEMAHDLFRETDELPSAFFVDGPVAVGQVVGTDTPINVLPSCSGFGGGGQQGADVLLSNSNLTATGGNVGAAEIAQSCAVSPGYFYFEVSCDTVTTADNDGVGISLAAATPANINNSWTKGYGFGSDSHLYFNGSSVGSAGALTTGDYLAISVDLVHGLIAISKETTPGIDPYGTNNPGLVPTAYSTSWSASLGTDISAIFNNVSACLTALFRANTADVFTVNNGPTFRFLKPMGMSTGWNGRDYNTPCGFDSATHVGVLSYGVGNDYYAMTLNGATANTGSRSKFGVSSGKYYMEWSTSQRGGNEYFGICDTTATVGAAPGTHFKALNCPYSNQHGELCVDFSAKIMWVRGKHADSWTGGGDPALGTGGTSLSTLTGSLYFAARSTLSSTVFLAITDTKGMLNSPPAGFTAGWPTS